MKLRTLVRVWLFSMAVLLVGEQLLLLVEDRVRVPGYVVLLAGSVMIALNWFKDEFE